jgi:predicted heme/steroid binding protein/uncharacterized membrane protein
MAPEKEFTSEELKRHNGKEQPEAYVAYEGKLYDVSGSKMWKGGLHMRRHSAGGDLTADLKGAPHGPEVLERVPRVGVLKPQKNPMDENIPEILLSLFEKVPMLRRHPHPMTVHFPLAFCLAVPFFNFLYLLFGEVSFERTAFHLLVLAIPSAALAMMTGPYSWWLNYGAKMNINIAVKMTGSSILFVLLVAGFFWRLCRPGVLLFGGTAAIEYFILTCLYAVLVTVLGWFGAKMTFPA